ncbi:MAG: Unknown protein [uncultured Sulfurovum sp.]|uniref:DUF4395 domain-containing protein n=1 Tax=uncultured Sulfurovum sp. TaxID=269237 RepID=A0A6S6STC4_9BACT|nr:MAG: Unknown protein [uncultured Sulfurovum sp.]
MNNYLYFGEKVEGYGVAVINEREARAAAGILFFLGMVSFFNAYLLHDFRFTQVFVTLFMVDFIVRVLINPKYAPTLILGRFFTSNQKPEYVGAKQKRFAWSIGLFLSVPMFFIIVVFEYMTPIKIAVCILCLLLLFAETAFGICIGCKIYRLMYQEDAQYCPGSVCEMNGKEEIQKISTFQWTILIVVLLTTVWITVQQFEGTSGSSTSMMKCQSGKCGGGQ